MLPSGSSAGFAIRARRSAHSRPPRRARPRACSAGSRYKTRGPHARPSRRALLAGRARNEAPHEPAPDAASLKRGLGYERDAFVVATPRRGPHSPAPRTDPVGRHARAFATRSCVAWRTSPTLSCFATCDCFAGLDDYWRLLDTPPADAHLAVAPSTFSSFSRRRRADATSSAAVRWTRERRSSIRCRKDARLAAPSRPWRAAG